MLYKAFILPHLDYCDEVWWNAGKTQLKILDRLQNAAGKIILGLPRRYPTEILLNTLRWYKLENRRNLHLNILVYKSLTNTLPSALCNIFFSRWATAMDTKLGLPPMVILFHQQIVVSQRKGSSHLGVLPRLTFFPTGQKHPCQSLLVFLNGL